MRKLIIVLMLVALLAGCAKPPEPTPTPEPTATNTPEPTVTIEPTATNTPEPTATAEPTATNTLEPTPTKKSSLSPEARDYIIDMFNGALDKNSAMNCDLLWDEAGVFKWTCEATDPNATSDLLPVMCFRVTQVAAVGLNKLDVKGDLPEDFQLVVIALVQFGMEQMMSKTSYDTFTKMMDGKITTQIEWEQEAEIIK